MGKSIRGPVILSNTTVKTTAGNAALTDDALLAVNKASGAATTVTLPASPSTGQIVEVKDAKGDAQANPITVTPAAGTIDGDASVTINSNYGWLRLVYNGTEWNVIGASKRLAGSYRVSAPVAATTTSLVSTVNLTNTTLALATQPDYPRNLVVTVVDTTPSITAGTVTVTGTLADGTTDTEAFNCAAGAGTYTGSKAFAKVTSVVTSGFTALGGAGDETIAVGVGTKLGLPVRGKGLSVYKECLNQADEAVGTVSAANGTVIPTTAANGSRNFDFFYTYDNRP